MLLLKINWSRFSNPLNSPQKTKNANFMRDFITPGPVYLNQKAQLIVEDKLKFSTNKINNRKPIKFYKHQAFNRNVRYPKVLKERKLNIPRHRKNFSSNELSGMLEVISRSPNNPVLSVKTPSKITDRDKSADNNSTNSFEDL